MAEQTSLPPAPAALVTAPTPFSADYHVAPSFDVLELLPDAAADRLRALRQRSSDAHTLIPAYEEIRQANIAKVEAANNLTRLVGHPQDFGFNLKPDDRRVVAAQKLLDKLTADAKRLTELQEVRSAAWRAASQALAACEDWLKQGRPGGTTLEAVEVEPLARGESGLLDAIENRRRRVRELRADLHRIESAPFPSSYCKERARASVEALARRGAPDVMNVIEHDTAIIWPTQRVQSEVFAEQRALAFHEAVDVVGLVAFLLKPTLISALDALITAEAADDDAALTHEQRQQRTAEVMGDLLAVEREESALVWNAQAQALPVEHRHDIDALALLGLRLVTRAAPVSSPGTSPELAIEFLVPGR